MFLNQSTIKEHTFIHVDTLTRYCSQFDDKYLGKDWVPNKDLVKFEFKLENDQKETIEHILLEKIHILKSKNNLLVLEMPGFYYIGIFFLKSHYYLIDPFSHIIYNKNKETKIYQFKEIGITMTLREYFRRNPKLIPKKLYDITIKDDESDITKLDAHINEKISEDLFVDTSQHSVASNNIDERVDFSNNDNNDIGEIITLEDEQKPKEFSSQIDIEHENIESRVKQKEYKGKSTSKKPSKRGKKMIKLQEEIETDEEN